jgi:hypothetical protein
MPHTDAGLPFNGSVPLTVHTSRQGAEDAKERAPSQLVRYIEALTDAGEGLTDLEASKLLNIPLASVCARRAPLRKAGLIYAEGTRPGPTGVGNAIWRFKGTK